MSDDATEALVALVYEAVLDRDQGPDVVRKLAVGCGVSVGRIQALVEGRECRGIARPARRPAIAGQADNNARSGRRPSARCAPAPVNGKSGVLALVLPHFARARRLRARSMGSMIPSHWLGDTLRTMPFGVVLVTRDLRVVFKNLAGERILTAVEGLVDSGGYLRATSAFNHSKLEKFLHAAFDPRPGEHMGIRVMVVPRLSMPTALELVVIPSHPRPGETSTVTLFLFDRELRADIVARALQGIYGLTCREIAVVELVCAGRSLTEIERHLEIKASTVKSHLASAFKKTGTRRQCELVQFVFTGPAGRLQIGDRPRF